MDNPSAIAGLRLQHSFELEYSAEECRRMIEEYVSMGGGRRFDGTDHARGVRTESARLIAALTSSVSAGSLRSVSR
jgi:hypothetical protein